MISFHASYLFKNRGDSGNRTQLYKSHNLACDRHTVSPMSAPRKIRTSITRLSGKYTNLCVIGALRNVDEIAWFSISLNQILQPPDRRITDPKPLREEWFGETWGENIKIHSRFGVYLEYFGSMYLSFC